MLKSQKFIQGSPEWLEMRRNYIMASDAPIIMGVSKYHKTLLNLFEEKVGFDTPCPCNKKNSLEYGKKTEEKVRNKFSQQYNVSLSPDVIFSSSIPYLGASVDGISEDGQTLLEIKCTNQKNHELTQKGIVPEEFYPQLQHQLFVCNLQSMYYVSYFKDEMLVITVNRDEEYLQNMLQRHKVFWMGVETLEYPAQLEPTESPKIPLTDDEYERNIILLLKMEEDKKALENLIKDLKQKLIEEKNSQPWSNDNFELCVSTRKGSIDYTSIPELQNIDLEIYRKPSINQFSFKKKKPRE